MPLEHAAASDSQRSAGAPAHWHPLEPTRSAKLTSVASTGVLRQHEFPRTPNFEVYRVADLSDSWQAAVREYNRMCDTSLGLVSNDCATYALGLVEHLAGVDIPSLHALPLERCSRERSAAKLDILDW